MSRWLEGRVPTAGPTPTLTAIAPISRVIGPTTDVVLVCTGTGFTADSYIVFAGYGERTDFVSATEVSTILLGTNFIYPDDFIGVQVVTPNAGASNVATFQIFSSTARDAAVNGTVYEADANITGENALNAARLDGEGFVAVEQAAWPTGHNIWIGLYRFYWDGTAWVAGIAP